MLYIEAALGNEIIDYVRHQVRLYIAMATIVLVWTFVVYHFSLFLFVFNLITAGGYLVNAILLRVLVWQPCVAYCYAPWFFSIVLLGMDITQLVYVLVYIKSLGGLYRLIPIFSECSAIFILYKLWEKMNGNDLDIDAAGLRIDMEVDNPAVQNRPIYLPPGPVQYESVVNTSNASGAATPTGGAPVLLVTSSESQVLSPRLSAGNKKRPIVDVGELPI